MLPGISIELCIAVSVRETRKCSFQSGHILFLRKIRCAWVIGATVDYWLDKCHRIKEVWWKTQLAPLEGRPWRTSKMPCQFSIRFWKYGPDWPLALLSICLQVLEQAIPHPLLISSSWGPIHYPTHSIHSYHHTSIHILQGYLKSAMMLWGGPLCPPSYGLVLHPSASESLESTGHTAMTMSTRLCFKFGFMASLPFTCS